MFSDYLDFLSDYLSYKHITARNMNEGGDKEERIESRFDIRKFESKLIEIIKKEKNIGYNKEYLSVTELISCPRKVCFSRLNYPEDNHYIYPYLYIINSCGKLIHDIIQKNYDFDHVEKTVIDDEFKVKGRVDAVVGNNLIEIKTISTDQFDKLSTYVQEHYNQANIYAYILNKNYNMKVSIIEIIYVSRDLKGIKVIPATVNNDVGRSFMKRAEMIWECIKSKKLADGVQDKCEFCQWNIKCKENKHHHIDLI